MKRTACLDHGGPGRWVALGVALALLGALPLLAACGARARVEPLAATPDTITRHGELDVLGHPRLDRELNHGGTIASRSWSLRWQGAPLAIDTTGGMGLDQPARAHTVNTIYLLGDGAVPDLLVHVGDPNNAGVFHVVYQAQQQLHTPAVCKTWAGDNAVHAVDGTHAGERFHGPNYRALPGTQVLLLGSACVYHVAHRRTGRIPRLPDDLTAPYAPRAFTISPDARSIARLVTSGANARALIAVAELDGQAWQRLPVDSARMRYTRLEDIDTAWIEHHFAWQRGKDGRDRLIERTGFKPLPWRGSYVANAAQYEVRQIVVDGSDVFADFLARYPGAQRLPDVRLSWTDTPERRVMIEGETVIVTPRGFYIALLGEPYKPGQPGDPAVRMQLVRRLGAAFDAVLATGQHAALFAPSSTRSGRTP